MAKAAPYIYNQVSPCPVVVQGGFRGRGTAIRQEIIPLGTVCQEGAQECDVRTHRVGEHLDGDPMSDFRAIRVTMNETLVTRFGVVSPASAFPSVEKQI